MGGEVFLPHRRRRNAFVSGVYHVQDSMDCFHYHNNRLWYPGGKADLDEEVVSGILRGSGTGFGGLAHLFAGILFHTLVSGHFASSCVV